MNIDWAPYFNRDGFLTVEKNAHSDYGEGNGLLQTGLYYCIKEANGGLTDEDKAAIVRITHACEHNGYPILWRSPKKKNADDYQTHDDYWGWLAACFHANTTFPERFYAHAQRFGWIIDVQNPENGSPRYYFERFVGLTQLTKMCARIKLTYMDQLIVFGVIIWKAFNVKESDACMRSYCFMSVARKVSPIYRLASELWYYKIRKHWSGMGLAFLPYFKSAWHPITQQDWK